jgi:hypothetical protein
VIEETATLTLLEAIIITDGKQYYAFVGDGCKQRSGKASPVVFEEDQISGGGI